jgi:uncharacterized membrane-anchored protein YjiN (DUF445 family)
MRTGSSLRQDPGVPAAVLNPDELRRRSDLRRMKGFAGSLLIVAVITFALTRHHGGALGFVNAGAEAAMVGGLADWFAVTALFRSPLGLPIPHTAIIPTRKDALGKSLESFVASNFLSEAVVRDKVIRARVAARVGTWLSDPSHAARVGNELATATRAAIRVLRDEDVTAVLEGAVLRRVAALPWGPPLGRLLGQIVEDGTHHRLVDLGVDEAHSWLLANRETVISIVAEQAPSWSPKFVDDAVAGRAYREALRFVREVQADPSHPLRLAIDNLLSRFAEDLRTDPYTIHRVELLKERLINHPDVREGVASVWSTARRLLLEAIDDENGELRRRTVGGLVDLGRRLASDTVLQGKVDGYLADATAHAAGAYSSEVATVISDTIARWDGAEASRRIELQVGRDLQFIRINGTVVGALAGLAIHTITVLAG